MAWSYKKLADLSDLQYQQWLALLEQRTGISFERHRLILQTGLSQRMREVECDDYDDYYQQVFNDKSAAVEWSALLKTLTVKETRFFRDEDAISFVKSYMLEKLQTDQNLGSLEIWSVAS